MRRNVVLLFLLAFLVLPGSALAQQQGSSVVLPQGQTVEADYFASGNTVTIAGTVNGDAYVAAGNLIVTGTINGDLLAVGGTVNVSGSVIDDVRVIGGQVIVSGQVGDSVSAVGGAVNLTDGARVGGSLVAVAGSVSVFAPVARGINAAAGQMTLANTVNGDVRAYVGQLVLTPTARITGNLTYWSDINAEVQQGAVVTGQTTRNTPPQAVSRPAFNPQQIRAALARAALIVRLIDLISAFIIGLLLLYLFPAFTQRTVDKVRHDPWKSLGVGLLALIVVPIIIFILLALVVGIPLALILLPLYLIAIYLSRIFVVLLIGQLILKKSTRAWALLLGLVLYAVVTLIPLVGPIVAFLTILFGLGALVLASRDHYEGLRDKNLA